MEEKSISALNIALTAKLGAPLYDEMVTLPAQTTSSFSFTASNASASSGRGKHTQSILPVVSSRKNLTSGSSSGPFFGSSGVYFLFL